MRRGGMPLAMGFECRFFPKSPAEDGILAERSELDWSRKARGSSVRSECLSAERAGFAGCRHTSRKA